MVAKKIRCICGKIYAPASHPVCPDCGTPCPDSQPLASPPDGHAVSPVVPDPLPLVPPEKQTMLDDDRKKRPWNYPPEPVPPQRKLVLYGILLGVLVGGWFILHPHPKPHDLTPKPPEKTSATSATSGTPNPAPIPAETPTPVPAKDPAPVALKDLAPVSPKDLAAEIAKAKPGATIKLAAGTYRSGFTIDRAIHLIGDSAGGPVIIESDNIGALQINAAAVILENLRFTGNPGGAFAVVKVLDKAILDLRQCVFETTGKFGVGSVGTGKVTASRCTFSTAGQGTGLQLEGESRAEVTDCLFKNNRWGWTIRHAARGWVKGCRFEQNGLAEQPSYSIGTTGEKTYAQAENCTFTDNPGGVVANERGNLILEGSTFKNTGVTDAPTHISYGTVHANTGGQIHIDGCTFDSNRQGLAVQSGGSAVVMNSQFTNTGLRAARQGLLFYCSSVSIGGQGSKVTLIKTNVRGALQNGINLVEGGILTMEDCEVSGALRHGMVAGVGDKLHSEATIVNCRFVDNKWDGLRIVPDSVVKISKSTLSHNGDNGISVSGDKATVVAEDCQISRNAKCGILSMQNAFSVLESCTLQGNPYGAQNGTPKGKDGSGLFLNRCMVADSSIFGVGGLDGTLTLDDCTFTNNKKNLYKTGGLILETSTGKKPLPSEQRTGVEPTGQTGGKTGMDPTAPAAVPADRNTDSPPQKKPAPLKRKPTPAPASTKADQILRDVLRHLPR